MNKFFKTEGIIIKRRNIGESDKLITVFTSSYGKIVALAKGIRKINSRKAPHLELFNHTVLFITVGKTINIINEAEIINSFSDFRKDLEKLAYTYKIIEEIDILLPQNEIYEQVFKSLLEYLNILNTNKFDNVRNLYNNFTYNLLGELGFLSKNTNFCFDRLNVTLENIIERKLRSDKLLTILYK